MSDLFSKLVEGMHYDDPAPMPKMVDPARAAANHIGDLEAEFQEAERDRERRAQQAQIHAARQSEAARRVKMLLDEVTSKMETLPEVDRPKSVQIAEFLANDLGIKDVTTAQEALSILYQEGSADMAGLKITPIDAVWQAVTKKLYEKANR